MGLERSDFLLVLLGVTAKVVFLAHAQLNIKFNLLGEGLVAAQPRRYELKITECTLLESRVRLHPDSDMKHNCWIAQEP